MGHIFNAESVELQNDKMKLNLKGKRALVTGGSAGIGLAIKQALEK